MYTFKQLREKLDRRPTGQVVFDKKIKRIPAKIYKDVSGFTVYIDGDRLDSYKTQREAEKMMNQFVKTYKG
ncbi:hypothetical protein N8864_04300 [Gammaproteobacteria bacterium]|nr:hypothetical protein [Gammaproteobacteria bacterium]|tara:strand:- start:261 stop:473 length:213 start_codon:yes stop_codon:yes gene_type:complete